MKSFINSKYIYKWPNINKSDIMQLLLIIYAVLTEPYYGKIAELK